MARHKNRNRSSKKSKQGTIANLLHQIQNPPHPETENADEVDHDLKDVYDVGTSKNTGSDDSDDEFAVNSDNDEDIDSDEALDDEDQQAIEAMVAAKKIKTKQRHPQEDLLDEKENALGANSEENGDYDDFYDLSEMLAKGEADSGSENEADDVLLEEEEDEDAYDDSSKQSAWDATDQHNDGESDQDADSYEDERYQQVIQNFHNMSKQLVTRHERTEVIDPGMVNLPSADSTKVSLAELLEPLGDGSAKVGGLKKALAPLHKNEKKMKLDTPLGKASQNRIARDTAYRAAAKDISRWAPVVQQNRQADHISFAHNVSAQRLMSTVAALTAKFKPRYSMEKQIDEALRASKAVELKSDALTEAESLALKALSPEEAKSKIKELAKIRALNSYYEAKCRRMNKIKSKKYRKIRRKGDPKLSAEDLEDANEEEAHIRRLQQERTRAEERLTLRHKAKSKWAKQMASRGHVDVDARRAMNEQQELGNELIKKAKMMDHSDDDGVDHHDSDSEFDETKETAEEALAKLEHDFNKPPETSDQGINGMKFMQQALERQRIEAQQMLRELKAELTGEGSLSKQEDTLHYRQLNPATAEATLSKGRQAHLDENSDRTPRSRQSKTVRTTEFIDVDAAGKQVDVFVDRIDATTIYDDKIESNTIQATVKKSQGMTGKAVSKQQSVSSRKSKDIKKEQHVEDSRDKHEESLDDESSLKIQNASADENVLRNDSHKENAKDIDIEDMSNPWLAAITNNAGLTPELVVSDKSSKSQKQLAKLQKRPGRTKEMVSSLAEVESAVSENEQIATELLDEKAATAHATSGHKRLDLSKANRSNRMLIKQAFAKDDVLGEDFAKEKATLEEETQDKKKQQTSALPGWGSWTGVGIFNKEQKDKKTRRQPKKVSKRQDGKFKTIIMTKKQNKRLQRKQITKVPFPFKKGEYLEHSIQAPTGREWNTDRIFRRNVRPSVETQSGMIIQPMNMSRSAIVQIKHKYEKKHPETSKKSKKRRSIWKSSNVSKQTGHKNNKKSKP